MVANSAVAEAIDFEEWTSVIHSICTSLTIALQYTLRVVF